MSAPWDLEKCGQQASEMAGPVVASIPTISTLYMLNLPAEESSHGPKVYIRVVLTWIQAKCKGHAHMGQRYI
jgi:hypothetical protein